MDRRTFRRIYLKLHARFFFDDITHTGNISNLSGNGMYIKMDMGLYYYKPGIIVHYLLKSSALDMTVQLSRFVEEDDCYFDMGVELVDHPKQYLDFVASLGSSLNSARNKYHL